MDTPGTGGHGRRRIVHAALLVMASLAAACAGNDDGSRASIGVDEGLRIAAFDFAESAVLAELYAQTIEAGGTPVVRLGAVGPREITFPALELDVVDLVPEYLGTALRHVGGAPAGADTDAAIAELRERLEPLGLTALEAAPAEDTNVVVVTARTADELGVAAVSELATYADGLRFGGPAECPERPLCLVGLHDTYGLTFADFVAQRSQRFTAEALLRGEIDVALMFSTDPALATDELVALADDGHLQPAENIVPVIRLDALDRWGPGVTTALDELSGELTTSELQSLNARLRDGESPAVAAADWLAAHRLAGARD